MSKTSRRGFLGFLAALPVVGPALAKGNIGAVADDAIAKVEQSGKLLRVTTFTTCGTFQRLAKTRHIIVRAAGGGGGGGIVALDTPDCAAVGISGDAGKVTIWEYGEDDA